MCGEPVESAGYDYAEKKGSYEFHAFARTTVHSELRYLD
jgi:hypothetical protein